MQLKVQLPISLMLAISTACVPAVASTHLSDESGAPAGGVLVDVIEGSGVTPRRVLEEGSVDGTPIRYRITADQHQNGDTAINLQVAGAEVSTVMLRAEQFPSLDLRTFNLTAQSSSSALELIVTLRFGEESACFVNDDGRSRLRLHFGPGQTPVFNRMTFRHCEPVVTEVNLEPRPQNLSSKGGAAEKMPR